MTDVLETVLAAKEPKDLFGTKTGDAAKPIFRRLSKNVHPDRFEASARPRAEQAMANLTRLWDELTNPKAKAFVITTKRGTHDIGDLLAAGDVANVYRATSETRGSVVKIARSPHDSDLIDREVRTLKLIAKDMDPQLQAFYPQLFDAFKHRDASTKIDRRGVVMSRHAGGFMRLDEVVSKFPNGLDPRDAVWMFRRILIAVGGLHKIGVVHGGVAPQHCMMQLQSHGLVLLDYTASCVDDETVPLLAKGWEAAYPDEVSAKLTPTPATDIYMAAKTFEFMMGDRAPRQLRAFIKGCTIGSQKSRPGDAWALLGDFTNLVERLYGPRRFRDFRFPA